MPIRERTRDFGLTSGGSRSTFNSITQATTVVSGIDCQSSTEYCMDEIGNFGEENLFDLRKVNADPIVVSGSRRVGNFFHTYNNLIPCSYTASALTHSLLGLPTLQYLQTEALARANPASDPDVDVLNFGWELREFPRMIKSLGDLLKRGYSAQALFGADVGARFGWKPLIADLRTLLGVQAAVERRIQKLKRAKFGFQTQLGSWTTPELVQLLNWSNDIRCTRYKITSQVAWAHISYVSDKGDVDFGSNPDLQQKAFDLAFSTKLSYATIWNSFPWTWLIDYLANVGRYLEAYRGGYPVKVSRITLMRSTFTSIKDVVTTTGADLKTSGGDSTYETKHRAVFVNPTPSFSLAPGIGMAQLANLASLATAFMGRNSKVQRRTSVNSPAWYRKVRQSQNQVKAYGKSKVKLR